jgi:hypothetical protein
MTLEQKLQVCEAMLARLDAAMTSAEAEVLHSSVLEQHLHTLLDNLAAEQTRLDRNIQSAVVAEDADPGLVQAAAGNSSAARDIRNLMEQMARIRAVQGRLLLMLDAADSPAQQP